VYQAIPARIDQQARLDNAASVHAAPILSVQPYKGSKFPYCHSMSVFYVNVYNIREEHYSGNASSLFSFAIACSFSDLALKRQNLLIQERL